MASKYGSSSGTGLWLAHIRLGEAWTSAAGDHKKHSRLCLQDRPERCVAAQVDTQVDLATNSYAA